MLKVSNYKLLLLIGGLCLPASPIQARYPDNEAQNVVVAVAAIGFGTYCMYKLVQWLFPGHVECCQRVERNYDQISDKNANLINSLLQHAQADKNFIQLPVVTPVAPYITIPLKLDEASLNLIGRQHFCGSNNVSNILYSLESDVSRLRDDIQALQDRIVRISLNSTLYERMALALDRHELLLEKLIAVRDFCKRYAAYFDLLNCKEKVVGEYEQELGQLYMVGFSSIDNLAPFMRIHVMQHKQYEFPYYTCLNRLEYSIKMLSDSLARAAGLYSDIHNESQVIISLLSAMRDALVVDPAYEQEKQHRQIVLLERERNEALQRQARAMEQQAYAQERQARAQEQQAYEQRQQRYAQQVQAVEQDRLARAQEQQAREQARIARAQERQAAAQEYQALTQEAAPTVVIIEQPIIVE
jgi:hypothetical protein